MVHTQPLLPVRIMSSFSDLHDYGDADVDLARFETDGTSQLKVHTVEATRSLQTIFVEPIYPSPLHQNVKTPFSHADAHVLRQQHIRRSTR